MNQVERKVAEMNLEQEKKSEEEIVETDGGQEVSDDKEKQELVEAPEEVKADTEVEDVEATETDIQAEGGEETHQEEEVQQDTETEAEATTIPEEIGDNQEGLEKDDVQGEATGSEIPDDDTLVFYTSIIEKGKEFAALTDWALASNELANLSLQIESGPDSSNEQIKALITEFEGLKSDFESRKKEHYEELNRKREENLVKKKELLKELADIVNNEKWTATREISQISNKWEHIKLLPHSEVDALNERFKAFIDEFESHKVDRLVKKLEKEEENLTMKLLLLDKLDELNKESDNEKVDFEALNKKFDELIFQWRKIGRVPIERNEGVWDRFNGAQDTFNQLRYKHDKEYRKQVEKALEKKKKLIAEAETLVDDENIAEAARKVNKLHKLWKKTPNLPQKDENELWDAFKAATDAFNDKKSENLEVLRDQEQKNLEAKTRLIEKAEQLKETDDFEAGHRSMQALMEEWKKIGPVPRKKSSKIWKKFKSSMDSFYEHRRDHFKEIRGEQKGNLTVKKEIIEKLHALAEHEDPAKAVGEAKKLQEQFKKAGHVPIKQKNKIWKQYREACDAVYERYRSIGSDLGMERKLASQGVEPENRKQVIALQKEQSNLRKEISKLESESIHYEEAKTYFKPTNKGSKLRDEIQGKIDKAEKDLAKKQERLVKIKRELDLLTKQPHSESEE